MVIATAASLAAAALFAMAGVLQQRSSVGRPMEGVRLLLDLVRRPMWLSGIGFAILAYAFQALALAYGPLSLVQPLIVSELLFAIPLAAWLHRMRLRSRDWLGALAVAGGLATTLIAAQPHGGEARAPLGEWFLALAAVSLITAAAVAGSRIAPATPRTALLALAGGAVMGAQSLLLDATVEQVETEGWGAIFSSWPVYMLVGASIIGLVLIQNAFHAGPLAASMPVIDATEPAVAVTVSVALFGEQVRIAWPSWAFALVGIAVVLTGIVLLDTSPLLKALRRVEELDRDPPGGGRSGGGWGAAGACER